MMRAKQRQRQEQVVEETRHNTRNIDTGLFIELTTVLYLPLLLLSIRITSAWIQRSAAQKYKIHSTVPNPTDYNTAIIHHGSPKDQRVGQQDQ